MVNPSKQFPEPLAVGLSRIYLAQFVRVSALASNAVLLSKIVPAMWGGLN